MCTGCYNLPYDRFHVVATGGPGVSTPDSNREGNT